METAERMKNAQVAHWIIEEKLGEGGFGTVWRARHAVLERPAAIKMMSEHLLADPHFEARFVNEARAQANLQHPHILLVSDFFTEQGRHYLIMPFVDGQSLEKRLETSGPLPLVEALRIAQDVLSALDYAHQQGVIHRDVKPSNILIDRTGHAYLADFSIALLIGKPRRTETGKTMGTADYMSPEQIRRPKELDHRTDVYSFGCVLYQMLAGRPPFVASPDLGDADFYIKECHLTVAPPSLRQFNPNVPEAIEQAVLRALEKNPAERFAGCGEFARALAQVEQEQFSLIRCAACGHQNRIEKPELLAEAACGKCSKRLLPVRRKTEVEDVIPSQPAPTGTARKWKIAAGALLLAALIATIGWAVTAAQEGKARRRADSAESRLNTANTDLKKEKELRTRVAEQWPLSLAEVKLRNEDAKGNAIGGFANRFARDSIRYLAYHVTLQNNFAGIKEPQGKLGIKFIAPDGTVRKRSSNPGSSVESIFSTMFNPYSFERDLKIADTVTHSSGWGNSTQSVFETGEHRIEFWWAEKKIGEARFTVYDSSPIP
jgi:serine/threonine-protein kinase